jgi:hypothetical protein
MVKVVSYTRIPNIIESETTLNYYFRIKKIETINTEIYLIEKITINIK